jgi:hypothetical protein
MSNDSFFEQGKFIPSYKEKYKGTTPIVYRSSWERQLMMFLDRNTACISWGSESSIVPYVSPIDKQLHRYFIDFVAVFRDKFGADNKYYIEIKPRKQTIMPKPSPRKKQETYMKEVETFAVNCAKWKAAKEYAKKKSAKFIIITEVELFKKG